MVQYRLLNTLVGKIRAYAGEQWEVVCEAV